MHGINCSMAGTVLGIVMCRMTSVNYIMMLCKKWHIEEVAHCVHDYSYRHPVTKQRRVQNRKETKVESKKCESILFVILSHLYSI